MLICWFRLKQISTKSSLMMLLLTNEIWWPSISGCFDKLEVEVLYYELFNVMTINTHMFDFSQPNNKRIFIFKDPHPHPPLKKNSTDQCPSSFEHAIQTMPCHCIYACVCTSKFFSSVTDPRHSCPRQLQRHITMPVRSLPKPYSQIPRFPQPSFPNRPRISVSCSWMTDGYPWESSMWVFCFIPITLSCFKADVFDRNLSLSLSLS